MKKIETPGFRKLAQFDGGYDIGGPADFPMRKRYSETAGQFLEVSQWYKTLDGQQLYVTADFSYTPAQGEAQGEVHEIEIMAELDDGTNIYDQLDPRDQSRMQELAEQKAINWVDEQPGEDYNDTIG